MKGALLVITLFVSACTVAGAQPPADLAVTPLTIGQTHTVPALGAERQINVVLPNDYDTAEKDYPLVLMLDGGIKQDLFLALGLERWNQLWGRSQPAILVGIETTDRQRELLPPTETKAEQERYPTAGQSEEFRAWLAESLLPMLRETYRDDGRAFIIGESAAGHFVTETWVKAPELFSGYAALSPSLQWDNQSLSRTLATMPEKERPPLFISLANEGGETEEGMRRFIEAANDEACFADRRDSVRHSNSLQQLLPEALQYLLPTAGDWLQEYGLTVNCQTTGRFAE